MNKQQRAEYDKVQHRTKYGLINTIYKNQKKHSKKRGHIPPEYTKEELREWLLKQDLFHSLFEVWERSGYKRRLAPSLDRILDEEHYSFKNVMLIPFYLNNKRSHKDRLSGKSTSGKICRKVEQHTQQGEFIAEYHSMQEASRQTGISQSSISLSCSKKKLAGGYIWTTPTKKNDEY